MSEQFPPSSPLLGASEQRDVFNLNDKTGKPSEAFSKGREAYVTPNPSSTIGRMSSPASESRIDDFDLSSHADEDRPSHQSQDNTKTVRINKDFNILDPQKGVLRIPFCESSNKVLVGRSSRSCDYYIQSFDKSVSRIHLSVSYSSEQIVVNCSGHNGFGIHIPRPCLVYSTNVKDSYVVIENRGNITLPSDTQKKSIKLNSDFTEFTVNRNESIILPRVNNILIEIRNHLVLLNPSDQEEELTDEEEPVLLQNNSKAISISRQPSEHPETAGFDLRHPMEAIEEKLHEPITFQHAPKSMTPELLMDSKKEKKRTILADKINTNSNPNSPTVKVEPTKRKASSEEPPTRSALHKKADPTKRKKKKEDKNASLKPVGIDQASIRDIENVSEVNNILINHLAFSRLSSTPASFLNTISASTSKLSLKQIRTVLHNIESIGVISREGKDAAGKPLEEEYYYIPEKDTDEDRTKLVESIKGHGGLRSCRRTHKQYYWKKPAPIKK